ncbi:Replication factor C, subunit RFC4 [Basidiobolus ranarum]|uniref:Replication factor C, subunit RFC4 n=1 Tax=Basidiobolus ranarum TaxID=34480 RepID=A0ABR2W5R3_9FUNG
MSPSQQQLSGYQDSAVKGAVVGGLAGLAIGGLGLLVGPRFAPKLQTLSVPLKTYWVGSAVAAGAVINGERAYQAYDADVRRGAISNNGTVIPQEDSESTTSMSEFVAEHRYGIIGATWVAGMVVSGFYLSRQKYMTFSQKLVQARMYAQAITIIALTATAGISMVNKDETPRRIPDAYREKKAWEM